MQTIVNLGTGGADLNGQNGSTTSADSNDALFLDWPGDNAGNYVYLSGASGNGMSVPDDASFNVTDLDVRAYVAPDSWTAVEEVFVSRYRSAGDNRIFRFGHDTSGRFKYVWSENGLTLQTAYSTTTIPGTDGEPLWVRVTHDTDNGSGGNDITFYTSTDGTTWTQLGSTVTGGSTTSLYAGVWNMEFGVTNDTTFVPFAGKYYRAQFLDSIGGTVLVDVDCSQISSGADTSFTALTGQTVSINRSTSGRKSVAVVTPVWLFGTDDYLRVNASDMFNRIPNGASATVVAVLRQWGTPPAPSYWVSTRAGTLNEGFALLTSNGNTTPNLFVDDGATLTNRAGEAYTYGDLTVLSGVIDLDAETVQLFTNTDASLTSSVAGFDIDSDSDLFVGARTSGDGFADSELVAVAVFRRALTASEITALTTYYQNKVA